MKHYIIPIFIPHFGCPHQCVFCNQQKITGVTTTITTDKVSEIIQEHLSRINQQRYIEVAFYGGTFTGLPLSLQVQLLQPAYEHLKKHNIDSIRLSTRPDCINAAVLENLREFGVSTIELGVQSMDNRVLLQAERGHTERDTVTAVRMIKDYGFRCGVQLMPGLPGEDWKSLLYTANKVQKLAPDFLRLYPTVVIANTKLAYLYAKGAYTPLSLDEAVARTALLKLLFAQYNVPVIRMGLQATEELANQDVVLAGPYHPAFGEMVEAFIYYNMMSYCLESLSIPKDSSIVIHHHFRDTSKIRGLKNGNTKRLQEKYMLKNIKFLHNGSRQGEFAVEFNKTCYVINKKMLFNL